MRKGNLTDQQTLKLYRRGESLITLAIHEGMSVLSICSRLTRARKAIGEQGVKRKPSKLRPIDSVEELQSQFRELDRMISRMR